MIAVELAVQDRAGVREAARLGADRIEVCTALALGGLTPPADLVRAAVAARDAGGAAVHVLVRPRAGDSLHDAEEVGVMVEQITDAVRLGADGVVIGAVRDGGIDLAAVGRFRTAAGEAELTFHRALDALPDPVDALETLSGVGVARVLTSGGADRAVDGAILLREMAGSAVRPQIMAGGGVLPEQVERLVAAGVDAVHASAKRTIRASAGVSLGSGDGLSHETVDPALAAAIVAAVRAAGARP